jgi:uncharacterized protein (TIGR02145 family)
MKKLVLLLIAATFVVSATAQKSGTLTDSRDGKTYKTVTIGNQEWMAENLAYKPSSGKYWAYDDNKKNVDTYGYLYDWETACNVCPTGWHLPSHEEWTQLTDFVGSNPSVKLKAKEGWKSNGNGTDDYGFSALPGGSRRYTGAFSNIAKDGAWWSSTETGSSDAWNRVMIPSNGKVFNIDDSKRNGFSVRCIKD